jgi:thiol-disulfide isomerase/thioredoxin
MAILRSLTKSVTLAILLVANLANAGTRSFVPGSYEELKKAHEGKPFVLMVWSTDCLSCVRELDVLPTLLKRHPSMRLVMVSTDEIGNRARVETMLAKHGLADVESWIFADANTRRLRYEIDSSWYGELPRSYFYDASHDRVPLSGVITEEHVDSWLAAVKR